MLYFDVIYVALAICCSFWNFPVFKFYFSPTSDIELACHWMFGIAILL